jgi:hypothetical protein
MMCIRHSSVSIAFLLLLLLDTTISYAPLSGVKVKSIIPSTEQTKLNDNNVNVVEVDLGEYLQSSSSSSRTMLIFGTYAADFNAIEYAQRLRYYLPRLRKECQITKFGLILNSDIAAAQSLCHAVDLPTCFHSNKNNNDNLVVDIFIDPTGYAGKKFGVNRGWLPNNPSISPYVKLFGMLLGLGAWATLPAVIGGYLGNPFVPQPWIEDALVVGTKQGRWPDNAIQITRKAFSKESSTMDDVDQPNDSDEYSIQNQFEKLPWFGSWKRRPLELATLRLQSMLGISLALWDELSPNQEGMDSGVLTQLGGLLIYESSPTTGQPPLLEWRDPGICAVANFEDIIPKLRV